MFRFFCFLLVSCFAGVQVHVIATIVEEESSEVKPVSYGTTILPCYGSAATTGWHDMGYAYNHRYMGYTYNHRYILTDNLTMFFTPSRPGSQRIQVSENGVVLDPHYNFTNFKFIVHDVTEKDDGRFSVLMDGILTDVLTLEIQDCAEKVEVNYGDTYSFSSPYFHYAYALYFAHQWYSDEPAVLLWNRTGNPQAVVGRMGRLVGNKWMIEHITQSEHTGYYTFRGKNGEFAWRRKMVVEAMYEYFDTLNGEFLFTLEIPDLHPDLGMTFTPHSGGAERVLMMGGEMVTQWEWVFDGRMSMLRSSVRRLHIRITDVQPSDAGLLKFRDQRGNLALVVELDAPGGSSHEIYISICVAVGMLLVLVLCCVGVRKHMNKSRRNNSAPLSEAAAAGEAVSFTDFQDTTQPSTSAHPSSSHGPTYSAPLSPKEPGSTDHQPLAPGPVQSISASGLPVFIHPTIHF